MRPRLVVLLAAAGSVALYAALAATGDLAAHVPAFLAVHAALIALMLVARHAVDRGGVGEIRLAIAAAVVFRLVGAAAPPSLSDDVYRYVWDGRVQAAGHHPYRYAPDDPRLAALRDSVVFPRVNHPDIPTIYPPLAETLFAALASAGLGPLGFKLVLALLDVLAVVALAGLLRRLRAPPGRLVLYAWNPLAVVEVAFSGHVEPLGVLFVLLAVASLVDERPARGAAALAAAIQAKLLPLVLVPGLARRFPARALAAGTAVIAVTTLPYAIGGPAYGAGVHAYARSWEHGAVFFAGVRAACARLDLAPALTSAITEAKARFGGGGSAVWDLLYRSVWPETLARITVAAAVVVWSIVQSFRRGLDPAAEARHVLGAALLLSPTLHPWYVLWVLPLAAAQEAWGWMILGAAVPLGYLAGPADLSWPLRLLIVVPALLWMTKDALRSRR
ncbi:MAG TPA: hypothetical protein VFV19_04090 [Candidatus Polarisedimenticolaceae bacterium]|nr:hypothetical protein [Candidatus Polarisedimenticolaceae bacterium]